MTFTDMIVFTLLEVGATLFCIAIGYSLGRNQTVVPPDMHKKITQIFNKVIEHPDLGAVERPTVQDNFYRDNPKVKLEDDIMDKQFTNLNK